MEHSRAPGTEKREPTDANARLNDIIPFKATTNPACDMDGQPSEANYATDEEKEGYEQKEPTADFESHNNIQKVMDNMNVTLQVRQEAQPAAAAPETDSGYASLATNRFDSSMKHAQQATSATAHELDEQDSDDAATAYSNAPSATFSMQEEYIEALADDLFKKMRSLNVSEEPQTGISMILPELLQAFALKVGHDAPTPIHLDVMAFVHKHRR